MEVLQTRCPMEASRSGRPPTRQAGPPRYLHRTAGSQRFLKAGHHMLPESPVLIVAASIPAALPGVRRTARYFPRTVVGSSRSRPSRTSPGRCQPQGSAMCVIRSGAATWATQTATGDTGDSSRRQLGRRGRVARGAA